MAIVIKDLRKAFGAREVLRGVSLRLEDNAISCIMGDSGCGKTTLLRVLLGLEESDSGTIEGTQGRTFSAVFQEDRLLERFSAITNVAFACPKSVSREEIVRHLTQVGLGGSETKPVHELSGGMKRRVAIVRAVLALRDILLLDEPLKGLDEQNKEAVAKYIKEHTKGACVIMVTHDASEVELMGARLIRMRGDGTVEG